MDPPIGVRATPARILLLVVATLGGRNNHLFQNRAIFPSLSLHTWGHIALTLLRATSTFFPPSAPDTWRMLTFVSDDDVFLRLQVTLQRCVGVRPATAHTITLPWKPAVWLADGGWATINPAFSQAMRTTLCAQTLYLSDGALVLGKQPYDDTAAEGRWQQDWLGEHSWYRSTDSVTHLDPTGVGWATPSGTNWGAPCGRPFGRPGPFPHPYGCWPYPPP